MGSMSLLPQVEVMTTYGYLCRGHGDLCDTGVEVTGSNPVKLAGSFFTPRYKLGLDNHFNNCANYYRFSIKDVGMAAVCSR